MDSNCLAYIQQISPEDWETTPASVKKLVGEMAVGIGQLEKKVVELEATQQHLLEQINRTSKNSSVPPSSDPPNTPKQQPKRKSGKKRGGQQGHKGHNRSLYSPEQCVCITDHYPETCSCCGEELSGKACKSLSPSNRRNPPH